MNNTQLHSAILEAAESSSNLSNFEKFRIRRIMTSRFRGRARQAIMDDVGATLLSEGVVTAGTDGVEAAVDWAKIIEAVQKLLPIILELISMFGG